MGIAAIGGVTESAVRRILRDVDSIDLGPISVSGGEIKLGELFSLSDGELRIGDDEKGLIIHNSAGETKEGVFVDEENWIEVYGAEVHFSEVQQ